MTFKELPSDIQEIAAHVLRHHLSHGSCNSKTEAVNRARDIKAAFIELFSDDTTSQNSEDAAGAALYQEAKVEAPKRKTSLSAIEITEAILERREEQSQRDLEVIKTLLSGRSSVDPTT